MENMRGDPLSCRHRVLLYSISILLGFHLGEFGYVESIYHHEGCDTTHCEKKDQSSWV